MNPGQNAPQYLRAGAAGFARTHLAGMVAIVVVAFAAYAPTVRSLLGEWNDTGHRTYTHGYLVAILAAWLLFRVWQRNQGGAQPCRYALLPLVLLGTAAVVLQKAGIEIGHQLLLPVLVWVALLAAFGWRIARTTLFPVGYLYFAIPVWTHFNGILQGLTIAAVRLLLRVTGIPAYFEGDRVEIPSGVFEIADGCSGLHFLIVALALAALYGELQGDGWRCRARQIALVAVLSIVANWIRVYTIIVAGHVTEMQHYLVAVDHYYFGWFVFAIAMTAFLFLAPTSQGAGGPVVAAPQEVEASRSLGRPVLLALAALVAAPLLLLAQTRGQPSAVPQFALPQIAPWAGPTTSQGEWQPLFAGADVERMGTYRLGEEETDLYVAIYVEQRQGKELMGYGNSVVAPLREVAAASIKWQTVPIREYVAIDRAGRRSLIWAAYAVGPRRFSSGLAAQLWYGFSSLADTPRSEVLALRALCGADCEDSRPSLGNLLERFSAEPGPTLMQSAEQAEE